MKRMIFIIILLLLLCGCTRELQDYTLDTTPTTQPTQTTGETVETKPFREYATYPVEQPAPNVIGNIYYFTDSAVISYRDLDLRRRVVPCSQPNCTHSDRTCVAYLGGDIFTCYQVVGDTAYALISHSESSELQFVAQNLVSGERTLIWDLTPENGNLIRQNLNVNIDGNTAFITFIQREQVWEGNNYSERNEANYAYAVDLTTGKRELLLAGGIDHPDELYEGDWLDYFASTEQFLVVYDSNQSGQPMSMSEFVKQYPSGNYFAYYEGFYRGGAYYSINRETGERTRICGNFETARLSDAAVYRDKKMSFVEGDIVCIYDGRTGEITPCFRQERIGFQNLLDGRIIYNVRPKDDNSDEPWDFYWYDLTTGERQQFQKGVKGMIFSVMGETKDYFYGYCQLNHGYFFLSKQDFYNENYDAAF